MQVDGSGRLSV
uniref:Uncharacterized protein n=1 Tax=Anguilla anguilla TaxID=7936 RepID=A0A0E9UBM9_ANGAN